MRKKRCSVCSDHTVFERELRQLRSFGQRNWRTAPRADDAEDGVRDLLRTFAETPNGREAAVQRIPATDAQLLYEWRWLMKKLRRRSPIVYRRHLEVSVPSVQPLFRVVSGPVAEWEHVQA